MDTPKQGEQTLFSIFFYLFIVLLSCGCLYDPQPSLLCNSFLYTSFTSDASSFAIIIHSSRDIVQFVPFRDYRNKSAEAFSSELLAEIPYQLTSFMKSKGLKPRPRQMVSAVAQPVVAQPIASGAVMVDVGK